MDIKPALSSNVDLVIRRWLLEHLGNHNNQITSGPDLPLVLMLMFNLRINLQCFCLLKLILGFGSCVQLSKMDGEACERG